MTVIYNTDMDNRDDGVHEMGAGWCGGHIMDKVHTAGVARSNLHFVPLNRVETTPITRLDAY